MLTVTEVLPNGSIAPSDAEDETRAASPAMSSILGKCVFLREPKQPRIRSGHSGTHETVIHYASRPSDPGRYDQQSYGRETCLHNFGTASPKRYAADF